MSIEFVYDNLVKDFVVFDTSDRGVVFMGGVDVAPDAFMLALFNVPDVKENDGRS